MELAAEGSEDTPDGLAISDADARHVNRKRTAGLEELGSHTDDAVIQIGDAQNDRHARKKLRLDTDIDIGSSEECSDEVMRPGTHMSLCLVHIPCLSYTSGERGFRYGWRR